MKTEDLKAKGLTEEQISFVMAENGKDISKLQKQNENLTAEKENLTKRAEDAETTLKKFEGIDPEKIQSEIADWKKKAEDAEAEYNKKLYERDFNDKLREELENIKFSSEAAKREVMRQISDAGVKLKDGKIIGLNDILDQIREKDASAFIDEENEKLIKDAPKFTQTKQPEGGKGGITVADIKAIKDPAERQKAIAQHIGLFRKD